MECFFFFHYTVINYKVLLTSQNKTISRLLLTVSRSTEAATNKSVQLGGMLTAESRPIGAPDATGLPAGPGKLLGNLCSLYHLDTAILFWALQARLVSAWVISDNQGRDTATGFKNLDLQFFCCFKYFDYVTKYRDLGVKNPC